MIPRYTRPVMANLWSDQSKWQAVLDVEILICQAHENLGNIPNGVSESIAKKALLNIPRMLEIEKEVGHDVIAFLTSLKENLGDEARYLHFGVTSSDVLDTGTTLQISKSCQLLEQGLQSLLQALKKRAFEEKETLCVGRSHGMYADYTTIGVKFARMYAEFQRGLKRLAQAKEEISVCAISGAVGTYNTIPPEVETYVAEKLGLAVETVSSQVIPRDRYAYLFTTLGILASSIENIAVEIRHLQRSEVGEVAEPFSEKQKGSSAMPHKKNPILCENLTGIARLIRSYCVPAMENVALWHERDISHSSVERIILPDAFILMDFAIDRLTQVISGLTINADNIAKNLDQASKLMCSQEVLLSMTAKGIDRDDAYRVVQQASFKGPDMFMQCLLNNDIAMQSLGVEKIRSIFDKKITKIKHLDTIFSRVFGHHEHNYPNRAH